MKQCDICNSLDLAEIKFNYFFVPTSSKNPTVHKYTNYFCSNCGTVSIFPRMSQEKLISYYNSTYRESEYSILTNYGTIEPPIQIPRSGVSFRRFQTFYDLLQKQELELRHTLKPGSKVLDIGGYQGMFLYAMQKAFGCQCVVADVSKSGIQFAKNAFQFSDSFIVDNIENVVVPYRFCLVSMIHSFEHIEEPKKLLANIRKNILSKDGMLYLEIPNASAHPLDDPTHVHMYTPKSLTNVLELCGFEIICMETTGFGCNEIFASPCQNIACFAKPRNNDATIQNTEFLTVSINEIRDGHKKTNRYGYLNSLKLYLKPFKSLFRRISSKFST